MDVLVINNGTKHIRELVHACEIASATPTVISWRDLPNIRVTNFHRIILSGSSQFSVPKEPHYADQRKLILETSLPLLGICAGFQLISLAFGSPILKSPYLISGSTPIRKTHSDSIFPDEIETFTAYEHHRYYCPSVRDPLIPLAMSETGVEMARHKEKCIFGCQFHPEVSNTENEGRFALGRFLTSTY